MPRVKRQRSRLNQPGISSHTRKGYSPLTSPGAAFSSDTDFLTGSSMLSGNIQASDRTTASDQQVDINRKVKNAVTFTGSDQATWTFGSALNASFDLSTFTGGTLTNDLFVYILASDYYAAGWDNTAMAWQEGTVSVYGQYNSSVYSNDTPTFRLSYTDNAQMVCLGFRNATLYDETRFQLNYSDTAFVTTTAWTAPSVAGKAGGYHVVGTVGNNTSTVTTPTGYTLAESTAADKGIYVFYKQLDADGETGTVTLTLSANSSGRGFSFTIDPKDDVLEVWDGVNGSTSNPRIGSSGVTRVDDISSSISVAGVVDSFPTFTLVTKGTDQSITDVTATQITLTTADWDTGLLWDNANDLIEIYDPGIYTFTLKVRWEGNATGDRRIWIEQGTTTVARSVLPPPGTAVMDHELTYHLVKIDPGYMSFAFWVRQSSGGALNVNGDSTTAQTYITVTKIGRLS